MSSVRRGENNGSDNEITLMANSKVYLLLTDSIEIGIAY
jgi:hypothetical protein